MKWIGQQIYDLVSRFRDDVYLEDISTGTIASGGNLGLDSNNKIVKATGASGDLTSIVAGTGLSGTSLTGPIPTLNVDASIPEITTLAGLTSFGAAGATTNIVAGDLTMYDATGTEANPTISLGSSATNRLEIKAAYNSGSDTLCDIDFTTYTTSGTANDGRFNFYVDEVQTVNINDGGLYIYNGGNIQVNADGATLSAYDTTTSSATEGGRLRLMANDGAVMGDNHRLGVIEFYGAEDGSNTISVGARIQAICRDAWDGSNNDADLEFYTTDGTTESKVLTLDADKLATFAGAVTVTGALTGTLATVSQPNITGVGTIGTGVWNGTAVASAYLDADTAHLSGSQTFTGTKTLNSFKGTGTTTVTSINDTDAFSDASATTLATSESIKAYADTKVSSAATRQVTHHMITDDIDSGVIYISLGDIDSENASATSKNLPLIAPTAGKLLKIFLRTSVNYSGETFTWKLYTRSISSSTGGSPSEIGAQSGTGPTNASMVTYDFTSSLDSGTNAIVAGDKVQISIEAADGATANGNYFITCLWEWDLS